MLLSLSISLALLLCDRTVDSNSSQQTVVVVGSVNADIIVPISKFPQLGETILADDTNDCGKIIAGGKGANQAVSSRKLGSPTSFVCMFGNDANAQLLKSTLLKHNVDLGECLNCEKPSGIGLAFLQPEGAISAIVLRGSNFAWNDSENIFNFINETTKDNIACIMLQMEIPQHINEKIASIVHNFGIPVFQDVGGEAREISSSHLQHCTYISPNLSELRRLTNLPVSTTQEIIMASRHLQRLGARNILVTLGSKGSILIPEASDSSSDSDIIFQDCYPVEDVVDETGAGDNYRAAFVVSHFVEKRSVKDSMSFASAAGAVAVSKLGAITSCATREECETLIYRYNRVQRTDYRSESGDSRVSTNEVQRESQNILPAASLQIKGGFKSVADIIDGDDDCPFKFASRLNSMKDRADLWGGPQDTLGWIKRQGLIKGLDYIDFNYPQHIPSGKVTQSVKAELLSALDRAGLKCGAMCLRYPKSMQLGALTNPDPAIRAQAIQLTKEACEWALELGASEVVVWSAFDGYDYSLQVNYDELWYQIVTAFQQICDEFPTVKVSLEYKPTDENTRFFTVPSTGAAILLMNEINRDNFGLTIDFGHCLMAGENPAQSIAMVHKFSQKSTVNKLFGVQLGDGYGRLGAEDGLAFGSIHRTTALEFVLWLIKTGFQGHIYFDTFPRNEDPVRECEYNIRQFKRMYKVAKRLLSESSLNTSSSTHPSLSECWNKHDAMSVLELLELPEFYY